MKNIKINPGFRSGAVTAPPSKISTNTPNFDYII
jgi:hypothetical protein